MNKDMTLRKLGLGVVGIGIIGVFLSLLADFLPGAKAGIQSSQILGIEFSIVILLIGIWMIIAATSDEKPDIRERARLYLNQLIDLPVIA
jgi:hypothetical protein